MLNNLRYYFNTRTVHLYNVFIKTNYCTNIHHNTVTLYNVHSYMFRHLCVILRDFKRFVPR